jgi:Arrestin (or S-antigen), N-terminal domain/Arrestin (or S-antigen), C-terminal domain
LLIEGKSVAEWTESIGKSSRLYSGEEKHINYLTYLVGDKDGDVELPVGIYTYKFNYSLPSAVPYSVDGEFGHIRYKVEANLDIPWTLIDLSAKVPFTVVRHENLNIYPELRMPQEQEEIKKFCWALCDKNPLTVKARLFKTGFALNEDVQVVVEYCNKSSSAVEKTIVSLFKKDKFICSNPDQKERVRKSKIIEVEAPGVAKNSNAKIEQSIKIPKVLMITNCRYSQVFQISYELKIESVTGGCSSSPIIKFPITIGSVGIREVPSICIQP